jgi:hypothetical protein
VGQTSLAPMCMPYSPEFLPQKAGQGAAALDGLAKATGGCERVNLAEIWKEVPRRPRSISLSPYLLLLAVGIFLLEVLQRRTGLFSVDWRLPTWLRAVAGGRWVTRAWRAIAAPKRRPTAATQAPPGESPGRAPVSRPSPAEPDRPRPKPASLAEPQRPKTEGKPADPQTGGDGMGDALSQAQQRARRRTERK